MARCVTPAYVPRGRSRFTRRERRVAKRMKAVLWRMMIEDMGKTPDELMAGCRVMAVVPLRLAATEGA